MSAPCPNCGASDVQGRACTYCHGALPYDEAAEREACLAYLRSFEPELRGFASPRVTVAFLGFAASGPIAYALSHSVPLAVGVGVTLFVAFGAVVASESRAVFREKIRPKLEEFIVERQIDRADFVRYAQEGLEPKSRLRRYATWF